MCKFLYGEVVKTQDHLASLRGAEVLKMAERAGLKNTAKWVNGESSKGENILRIARDLPPPLTILPPLKSGVQSAR